MALNRAPLKANLHSFYDFNAKVVLCIGAGRGQLLDPNIVAEMVLVDQDPESIAVCNLSSTTNRRLGRLRTVVADFNDVDIRGDVVYFEFCLHEMEDPRQAIDHARSLAPEVVIFEHSQNSEWVFYAAEEEGVCRTTQALAHFPIKCRRHVYVEQIFDSHAELVSKLSTQGDLAIQRAARFAGAADITIPMKCTLILI